jgi:hypothetical protein
MAAAEMKTLFTYGLHNRRDTNHGRELSGYGTSGEDRSMRTKYGLFANIERANAAFPECVAFVQHNGTAASQWNRGSSPNRLSSALFCRTANGRAAVTRF